LSTYTTANIIVSWSCILFWQSVTCLIDMLLW
jgi:hypothetical protein